MEVHLLRPGLADLDPTDRPRERFLREGAHALDPDELLAIVLGTGRGTHEDVLVLARRVLIELDGVEGLAGATLERLMAITGIGPVKATRIRAAFELALRAGPVEPAQEPVDPLASHLELLRGQVPTGATAILGYRPGSAEAPVTLTLGEPLGPATRAGALMARLLALPGAAPWWIVAVRPGGQPRKREQAVAQQLFAAAGLLDLPLEQVLVVGTVGAWPVEPAR